MSSVEERQNLLEEEEREGEGDGGGDGFDDEIGCGSRLAVRFFTGVLLFHAFRP
jgi:hypothetical protein